MIIGIMTVNGIDFHPNRRLLEAAKARGHEIVLINPYEISCYLEMGRASLAGLPDPLGISKDIPGQVPDVILPRQGSPMGEYGFVLLRHFMQMGIPLVNSIEGITIAKNQYVTLQTLAAAGIRVPDTCFITRKISFFKAVEHLGGFPVIAKQVDGMGGDGVVKIENGIQAEKHLDTQLNSLKGMLVQQFFNPGGRQDLRMLVIGGRVAGTMSLEPVPGDFRANIHQNSRATAIDTDDLPGAWADLALDAARACHLDIAGVDMILEKGGNPIVIEVNYSPGFRGLEQATGKDISRRIIEYVTLGYSHKT